MANKQKELEKVVRLAIEEDLHLRVVQRSTRGNSHPFIEAEDVDGELYRFTYACSPGSFHKGQIRAYVRRRFELMKQQRKQ